MQASLEKWVDKLQYVKLPALPGTTRALVRLRTNKDISMNELAVVIEKDPGLTLNLLRTINGLKHRHLASEVTTVEHALMMLGLKGLTSFSASVTSLKENTEPAWERLIMRLFNRAHHAAFQAYTWGKLHNDFEPRELYVAALLHDIGEFLLWIKAPSEMIKLTKLRREKKLSDEAAQHEIFGFGLEALSLELAKVWGLPSLIIESLETHDTHNARILSIRIAVHLARTAEKGWYSANMTQVLKVVAEYLGRDFGTTCAIVHSTAVDAAREANAYHVSPTAALLLLPSRPEAAP